ncbi:hypothetical protein [Stenotrophomonas maltophilia]|uniref:Transmembrane protein n=1 Tax=Stenotrophomonas maltophilia TaxID=40324 RepID=A0A4S2CW68_STEMA|nr:hypothetical protein [Stenotrophomonas maltophilia]TGY32722.1 hypothetical protein E5352_14930 [Stenotrophomonas maltophilia]
MDDISPYQVGTTTRPAAPRRAWDHAPRPLTSPIRQMAALGAILAVLAVGMAVYHLGDAVQISIETSDGRIGMSLAAAVFLVDACIQIALSWGVLRASRVAACLLMAYYLAGKVLLLVVGDGPTVPGLAWMVVVCGVMLRGTIATFRYHGHLKQEQRHPPRRLSEDPAFAPRTPALE